MRRTLLCLQLAVALATVLPSAEAGEWKHLVVVYVLGAGLSGEVEVGSVAADVDVSFSEIVENLDAAGMVAYRGETGRWSVMANAVFMGLGAEKAMPGGGTTEVDFDEAVFEVDGGRRIAKHWEAYAGLRWVDLDGDIAVRPGVGPELSATAGESWIDPLVGVRFDQALGSDWVFVARADIGGFGVGSELAWQASARVDWHISEHWGTSFGYLALDLDFEDGSGADFFRYDVISQGPFVAGTFTF